MAMEIWDLRVACGSFFIPFVGALTCLASSIQYANLVLIVILLQQPFLDDRWCTTTFGNLTMVDLEDCALPWKKTR